MIVIDGIIYSLQKMGGIGVYFNELLGRMPGSALPFSVIGYAGSAPLPPAVKPVAEVRSARHLERYRSCPVAGDASLFHSSYYRLPARRDLPVVTTVHDFTYERFAHGPRKWVHTTQKAAAIRRSQALICISESTRRDLLYYSPDTPEDRIFVIPNGVSGAYFPLEVPPQPDRPFAVFVGARGGYKNFGAAVQAVATVPGLDLVCVGGGEITGEEQAEIDRHLGDRFRSVGYISETELNRLYNAAACLIYPSAYEGFGIPVLEAMRAGCPVVAVAISSIPEVAGDAALLVEAPAVELLAAAMAKTLAPAERERLRARGIAQAAKFNWDRTFEETANLYRALLGRGA